MAKGAAAEQNVVAGPMIIPPEVLIEGYRRGLFPMADPETGSIGWYTADPRGVIDIHGFHVSTRLQRTIRQGKFETRVDSAFAEVVAGCADREDRWISDTIFHSYVRLHQSGYAHSVEAWRNNQLEGGVYGVAIRGAFFGESMFHRATDAGKVALVALLNRLQSRGFELFDTQMVTGGTSPFGAHLVPAAVYRKRLKAALALNCSFSDEPAARPVIRIGGSPERAE